MPKRTLLLIVLLSITTLFLVYIALNRIPTPIQKLPVNQQVVPTTVPIMKNALLYFDPETVQTKRSVSKSADILINASEHKVNVVQLELSYDPEILTNVSINPPSNFSFFGEPFSYIILFKEVDVKNGKINYAIGVSATSSPKTGVGKVATVTFNLKAGQLNPTQIKFLDKTSVAQDGTRESVLKEAKPLTITTSP